MRIALTGGIGSGKSTVARLLAERGAWVVDADAIAREIVEPGEPALREIVESFGTQILLPDGRLDRPRLAEIVFADPEKLARLNAITHPRIAERSAELIADAPSGAVVVYDMPLLVEQGASTLQGWDAIIVVDAPDGVRRRRLEDRGLSAQEAGRRMSAQATREQRLAVASNVIDNSGDLEALERGVDDLWQDLTAPRA